MKRQTKQAIRQTVIIAVVMSGLMLLLSILATEGEQQQDYKPGSAVISSDVLEYKPLVEKYADKNDVEEHVDELLAIMMQESGGRGKDPMQSSESYCGSRGCIENPERSIEQGVEHFATVLNEADGDVQLAIQSYNFGPGFIDYVEANSGDYTQKAAIKFSQEKYATADNQAKYRCPRKEAKKIDACYGDIYYVRDVMAYRNSLADM
ncbi:Lysozyme-like [Lentibacillus persicus]|uniref:Lysozyme-like n=1 Tax=Lentibacillus persicus TaxID=640948 RepID=A0A1I1U4N6_9BACI|nr:lysozyme family protein [Lentibacillus persicus]SFD65729.1 Lysozyme-like [Lentibacillus persicus]